ncbi:uncharacterized protein RJT21DRAFT_111015 [Scheffersomyces amazonensis]|uniref:uncharacterized protein n=1 Tax=Scheffersomyces amazonensis TaxID=1078765 RepID=UPI00315D2A2C
MKELRSLVKSNVFRKGAIWAVLAIVMLYTLHFHGSNIVVYKDKLIGEGRKSEIPRTIKKSSAYNHDDTIVIFPRDFLQLSERYGDLYDYDFHHNSDKSLEQYYFEKFNVTNRTSPDHLNIFQYYNEEDALTESDFFKENYKNHHLDIYNASLLQGENPTCKNGEVNQIIQIGGYKKLDGEIFRVVEVLQRHLKEDPPFQDLNEYIVEDIDQLIENNIVEKHFYKFAGTSVWLEQFGVHFMVSRIVYSHIAVKDKPIISLIYAQIFDENWRELRDVELVMPVSINGEATFKNLRFPSFLPVPFHRRTKDAASKYYGAEDPRMMLITNSHGFEEPLIVYNSVHRKIDAVEAGEETHNGNRQENKFTFGLERSMFLCHPFQYEFGMPTSVDAYMHSPYNKALFNKVIELDRSGRHGPQKNWTPFVNVNERVHGVDTHIYFIYRWAKIEVLRCELNPVSFKGKSICEVYFKKDKELDPNSGVGDLRGGTELIHINQYLPQLRIDAWVGLARAHIYTCGCGFTFYRPNLAIITRDEQGIFEIAYVSSFVSFNIPMIGFSEPNILCDYRYPNVLIPNGISSWMTSGHPIDSPEHTDYMTITLSAGDSTNHMISIKNFMKVIYNLVNNVGENVSVNDKAVECALDGSRRFCSNYGSQLRKVNPGAFNYED